MDVCTKKLEPIYAAIGVKIRDAREGYGWTQSDLAGEIGVCRASIANIELGKARISVHLLAEIADLFEVDARTLFPTKAQIRKSLKARIRELEKEMKGV